VTPPRHWLEDYRAPDPPAPASPRLPEARPGRGARDPRVAPRQTEPFLKGPIPLAWLARVAPGSRGSGSSYVAALVVWYVAGLRGRTTALPVSPRRHGRQLGVSRDTVSRGLRQLEAHGLVQVHWRPRGKTLVTIRPVIGPRLPQSANQVPRHNPARSRGGIGERQAPA
jgi:biotin operon repressor